DRNFLRAAVLLAARVDEREVREQEEARGPREVKRTLIFAVALLQGCTLGPDYFRPLFDSPAKYRIDYPAAADVANAKWWEQFNARVLARLVEDALRGNLDIKQAAARVDRFLGLLTTTRSQFFPQIGYGYSASSNQASRIGFPPLGPNADNTYNLYQGSLSAA